MSSGEQVTRFIRCPHCGSFHLGHETVCGATGKPLPNASPAPAPAPEPPRLSVDAPEAPALSIGFAHFDIDGRYRICGIVGQGGMGTVYEAEQIALGRRVALKVLHSAQKGRRESVERFQREARAASSIGHPNICEVYDVGRLSDGRPYMVMELLRGCTLAERIDNERSLPVRESIDIIMQVLSALVAAHDKAIIHRDIKPENVFLAERVGCPAVVKILDFGIHKARDEASLSLTRDGTVMGTPYYMAPEQARGEPFDHRIDLFACGVMLYEITVGRRPFDGDEYNALMRSILHEQPVDPCSLRPDLPKALTGILRRALQKDPTLRYPDATAFLVELDALQPSLGNFTSDAIQSVREPRRPIPDLDALDRAGDPPPSIEVTVESVPVSIQLESVPATTEPAPNTVAGLAPPPTAPFPPLPPPPPQREDRISEPPPTLRPMEPSSVSNPRR